MQHCKMAQTDAALQNGPDRCSTAKWTRQMQHCKMAQTDAALQRGPGRCSTAKWPRQMQHCKMAQTDAALQNGPDRCSTAKWPRQMQHCKMGQTSRQTVALCDYKVEQKDHKTVSHAVFFFCIDKHLCCWNLLQHESWIDLYITLEIG